VRIGAKCHRVHLQVPTEVADSGDGGMTQTWAALDATARETLTDATTGSVAWAAIEPAAGRTTERIFGAGVVTQATHLVTIRYRPLVTTRCRVRFGTRTLQVRGVANPGEASTELVLACEELT
jgi:head-tail adaptor